MTEKLKTAVRAAYVELFGCSPNAGTVDGFTTALSRRGVVVQDESEKERAISDALTPLTYEQACALPVGSEVVCLDVGDYLSTLTKGAVYKIAQKPFGLPVIFGKLGLIFSIGHMDCRLFAAVPPASAEVEASESSAPAITDEEIGREMLRIYDKSISSEHRGANGHYAQMGRRARELLQPCNGALQVSADGKTVAPICDLKIRLEKSEAALERVCATFEAWLRPAATTEDGKHADAVLWEVAREAGLRIIPAEPAKPLRVEVAP